MVTERRLARLKAALDRRQPDLTVLMDRVHKPHNLSAVMRTADAVGVFEVHAVAAPNIGIHHDCSAGGGKWVGLHTHPDLETAMAHLQGRGFQCLAAHYSERSVDFREIDYTRPTAVILGAEKYGLSETALARADAHITIPMVGLIVSLNVSVAAAVILYEAQRQRQAAGMYDRRRLDEATYRRTLFEWAHPELVDYCRRHGLDYPEVDENGDPIEPFPPPAS